MREAGAEAVTIAVPTYGRSRILVETIEHLLAQAPPAAELLVLDQTPNPDPGTAERLEGWAAAGCVRWIRLPRPCIPAAMNAALREAANPVVLFVDDDIVPAPGLVAAHARGHAAWPGTLVAGQVLQPGEEPLPGPGPAPGGAFPFNATWSQLISEFMGGNFSVERAAALRLGGFDENFVGAAYRFEAEFAERWLAAGLSIRYEPAASIRHLRAPSGGTRAHGSHLTTARPGHAVGAYYYLLRSRRQRPAWPRMLGRLARSVRTRHHLRRPWWIPVTLVAEVRGLAWALVLARRGPRLVSGSGVPCP